METSTSLDRLGYTNVAASIPPIWHYTTGSFALLCLLIGLISNGSVLLIFCKYSNLRRPRNYFLINLAITDLGLLITDNSMHVIASFQRSWPFGQTGCNIYAVCGGIFGLSSIASMAAIALIRVVVVLTPFTSLKIDSSFTIKCLMCSWLYGSIWILPPLFGWSRFIHEGFGTSCTFDYKSKHPSDRLFMLFLMMGGFMIPLSIIVISYTLILCRLHRRGRRYPNESIEVDGLSIQSNQYYFFHLRPNRLLQEDPKRSEILSIFDLDGDKNLIRHLRRVETRATRTALIVCTFFCLAWGPYSIAAALCQFGFHHLLNPYSTSVLALFTKTAACVNPFIYAVSSRTFRSKIYLCLNLRMVRRKRPSELQSSVPNSTLSP